MDKYQLTQLIKNIQALMRCPNCGSFYQFEGISILGRIDTLYLVHLDCLKCGMPVLATIVMDEKLRGISSEKLQAPRLFDREFKKEKISQVRPQKITADDIIDFHRFLENFDGDFQKAIK